MDGVDKPLEHWHGQPLVGHVLARLPTNASVLISANRNLSRYAELGWPVVTDARKNLGPLAGIAAAIPHLNTAWLYVVPGDAPLLPEDLPLALLDACRAQNATACYARTDQPQPLPLLVAASALQQLPLYLERGERSVRGWLTAMAAIELARPNDAAAFANFNTPEDLLP